MPGAKFTADDTGAAQLTGIGTLTFTPGAILHISAVNGITMITDSGYISSGVTNSFPPAKEIWTGERLSWVAPNGALPQFERTSG